MVADFVIGYASGAIRVVRWKSKGKVGGLERENDHSTCSNSGKKWFNT